MNNPIILIRGLFRSQFHWGEFSLMLQKKYPNRPVFCIDIPGVGERYKESSPKSILEMVDSIRGDITNKKVVDIVAISMGGMIALKWAECYPNEVRSIVCINTSAKGFSPFYQRLKPENYLKLFKALCSRSVERETEIYRLVSNKPVDIDVIDSWVKIDEQYTMSSLNFFRQLYAASTFNVSRVSCKLLFISSLKDRLVDTEATKAIALKWGEKLIVNEQDGHDIPLDNPRWLYQQISDWIQA
ncbi:alpha/beta fold hydrolase [Aliivibrio logei]|uniref:alpha/beta fold hydrolase n=1 Tax=Aliivibrio logei TaxID=688 RepID=UPI0003A40CC7|nr:alpha/beta hydrolase [Aliivibrio logei]